MTLAEALAVAASGAGVILTAIIYLHTRRSAVLYDIRNYIERLDTVGGRSVHAIEARLDALENMVNRNTKRIDRVFDEAKKDNQK